MRLSGRCVISMRWIVRRMCLRGCCAGGALKDDVAVLYMGMKEAEAVKLFCEYLSGAASELFQ